MKKGDIYVCIVNTVWTCGSGPNKNEEVTFNEVINHKKEDWFGFKEYEPNYYDPSLFRRVDTQSFKAIAELVEKHIETERSPHRKTVTDPTKERVFSLDEDF